MHSTTKIHSSLLIHFFIFLTLVLGLCSSTLEMDSLPDSVLSHDFQWSCSREWDGNPFAPPETVSPETQWIQNISHLKTWPGQLQVPTGSTSSLDTCGPSQNRSARLEIYKTCETSSIECQYQATVAARIGFANSQNRCIRICMNLYPVELCAFACLGALNHDRPIIACPDLALWRYCWLCWAKVSGRSMKKLSFSRHETFIIEQENMLASLGSVWFDEVTHPHKRSSCQKMS